jgi:plasmid stabilization system protein ParE
LPLSREHLVFFRSTEREVEIVRVLHGARDIRALFEGSEGE